MDKRKAKRLAYQVASERLEMFIDAGALSDISEDESDIVKLEAAFKELVQQLWERGTEVKRKAQS